MDDDVADPKIRVYYQPSHERRLSIVIARVEDAKAFGLDPALKRIPTITMSENLYLAYRAACDTIDSIQNLAMIAAQQQGLNPYTAKPWAEATREEAEG